MSGKLEPRKKGGAMNLEEKFAFMATGKPYDDMDPLLLAVRDEATAKTDALNNEP